MNGLGAYQETAVLTQDRGNLVVMLYEGAIRFLKFAIREIEECDYEGKGDHIKKAKDIINELNLVLDMEVGGEFAMNLRKIYCFCNTRLSEANRECDTEKIEDVVRILEELNKGWTAVANQPLAS